MVSGRSLPSPAVEHLLTYLLNSFLPSLLPSHARALVAAVNDYADKRLSQTQFGACMALLLQLDMAMTGMVSVIADVPTCKVMASCLRPAQHQQQEIAFELSSLFLVRRRLQELFDEEEADRDRRNHSRAEVARAGSAAESESPRGASGSSPDSSGVHDFASPLDDR